MSSSFDDFLQQNNDALQSTIDSTSISPMDGQNFSQDTYSQSVSDHHSLTETAYQTDPFSTENQWQNTSSTDGQNFSHDTYSRSAFDHHSLTETAYQSDYSSTKDQWQNTAFQSTPEHSLNQEIDTLLNGSNSSDDSNNLNANNLTMPTFQHHVHYHPLHEHFNIPSSYEGEHQRVASSETSTFHSSMDVNVSGSVDHYHRWVNPNNNSVLLYYWRYLFLCAKVSL